MNSNKLTVSGLLIFITISGCGNKNSIENASDTDRYCLEADFKQKIEIIQPELSQITEHIPLTGTVETNPDKVVHFVSLVGGIISNTQFSLGDKVTKGQVLAELRSTELSALHSELITLQSQIGVAENRLQSVQSMFDDGISSQKELMEAQSELNILKAEKEKVTSNLKIFSASTEKGIFQIKSPTSGIVTAKSISAGTNISSESEPLFTISDLSEVWVLVNVYATNLQNIKTGMPVNIKTRSYPDEVFSGEITSISNVFDAEANVLKARVVLQNKDLRLKPGMLVDVTAIKHHEIKAFAIPTRSLVFDNNQNFVVIYNNDCDMEIRQVAIHSESNGTTYIESDLNENEKVIARNQLLIYEQIKNLGFVPK
jgi:membrane fusion protein, heavy metal efflux system